MKLLLKALFGGGSSYIYLIGAGVLIGGYFYVTGLQRKVVNLKEDLRTEQAENLAKDGTIASQARQGERKANSQKDLSNAESNINEVEDSNKCAQSEPIIIALDQLRAKQGAD